MLHRTFAFIALVLVPLACNKGRYADQMSNGTGTPPTTGTTSSPPGGIANETNPPLDTARSGDTSDKGNAQSDQVAMGDKIFHGKMAGGACFSCHGQDAKGTTLAPDLTDKQWLDATGGTQESIVQTIKTGVAKPKKFPGAMPPMGGAKLSDDQVQAVAAYVYSLSH